MFYVTCILNFKVVEMNEANSVKVSVKGSETHGNADNWSIDPEISPAPPYYPLSKCLICLALSDSDDNNGMKHSNYNKYWPILSSSIVSHCAGRVTSTNQKNTKIPREWYIMFRFQVNPKRAKLNLKDEGKSAVLGIVICIDVSLLRAYTTLKLLSLLISMDFLFLVIRELRLYRYADTLMVTCKTQLSRYHRFNSIACTWTFLTDWGSSHSCLLGSYVQDDPNVD